MVNTEKNSLNPEAQETAQKQDIMAAHEQALLRYATGILSNSHAAQDVVQNVFIKLFRNWHPGLKPSQSIRPWLYRVTHNEAVDYIRHESRLRLLHRRRSEDPTSPTLPVTDNPGEERVEQMQMVLDCLGKLSAREKQMLLLRLQEGLSYRDISRISGRSIGNVGCVLHNAVKKIRVALVKKDNAEKLKETLPNKLEQ